MSPLAADVTFAGKSMADLANEKVPFAQRYNETGALYFPGLLAKENAFQDYVRDLTRLTNSLAEEVGLRFPPELRLEERLSQLAKVNRKSVGAIYDIGTRPAKLLSAVGVKFHAALIEFVVECFGPEALIATPTLSDTLHVFPPGEENYKYNLPIHQDYPYLMQSPNQITVWISLSDRAKGAGGITVWLDTHKLGIATHKKNAHGHYEVTLAEDELSNYPSLSIEAGFGDVLFANSLCLHRSDPNRTTDQTRITQLFRFSNLANETATAQRWVSTDYSTVGSVFPQVHPDRFSH